MTPDERQRLEKVEAMLGMLIATERYTFQKHLQILDGRNVILGKGTGTKFGTETTQKIGFFNKTPIVQPSDTAETTGFTQSNGTEVRHNSTFSGNVGSTLYTISDIVKALKNSGLMLQ